MLGNGDKNHIDVVEALVKAGADVDIKDRQGITALAHARQRGYADMVKILDASERPQDLRIGRAVHAEVAHRDASVLVIACVVLATPARAQTYPNHPVKLIVPFPAGGPIDVMARLVAQKLSAGFGNVMVENRPGGGSTIGLKSVALRRPRRLHAAVRRHDDDERFPAAVKGPEGDAIRAMTPVSLVSSTPFVLIVAPRVPAKTVQELIAYAKAQSRQAEFRRAGRRHAAPRRRAVQDEGRHPRSPPSPTAARPTP